jgi:hypothetical protein
MTPCPNCSWPHHVPEGMAITIACAKCGTLVHCNGGRKVVGRPTKQTKQLTPEQIERKAKRREERAAKESRLIGWLRWFAKPEDTGAGDTLERLIAKAGGRKFKEAMAALSLPCGCTDRQQWLNDRYPYHGGGTNGTQDAGTVAS